MFFTAGIRSEWPWWDDLHAYWRELPNYNPQGVQSSEPGTMHASEAANLFLAADEDELEELEYDLDAGGGDEQDVDMWDSRGGSPVDEDEISVSYIYLFKGILLIWPQWGVTPPPPISRASRVPTKLEKPGPTILHSPAPRFATSPSSPPSIQACLSTQKRDVATRRHGKPTLVKKTAVDRFNDSRQEESRRLSLKRKMEHDEKMASYRLKRHKYDLRYGSTPGPQTPDSSTPLFATAVMTAEDKQIEILRLQIRLAELTRDNSAHSSSSQIPHASRASSSQIPHASRASSSQMPHASSSHAVRALSSHIPHHSEEVSTPSSGVSSLSYISNHNQHGEHASDGFVNTFMTSMDSKSDCYHVPDGEAISNSSVRADMASWPESYNFAA
jgi:hypothetical protein